MASVGPKVVPYKYKLLLLVAQAAVGLSVKTASAPLDMYMTGPPPRAWLERKMQLLNAVDA